MTCWSWFNNDSNFEPLKVVFCLKLGTKLNNINESIKCRFSIPHFAFNLSCLLS